jgi:hypothetical protein
MCDLIQMFIDAYNKDGDEFLLDVIHSRGQFEIRPNKTKKHLV